MLSATPVVGLLRASLGSWRHGEGAQQRYGSRRSPLACGLGARSHCPPPSPPLPDQLEDDDEVLLTMAEQLGALIPLVGGPAETVCLLAPLAVLVAVEETVVRDKAVESAARVISGLPPALAVAHALPTLDSLATSDSFTARVSATGLFAVTYARVASAGAAAAGSACETLCGLFKTLCADDMPMVRRAAAKYIGALAAVVSHESLLAELLPVFDALTRDEQDSVRLLAIENAKVFAAALTVGESATSVLPLVKDCAGDKSWRVRHNVAKDFAALLSALGPNATKDALLPLFARLLRDPESEVRAAAARNAAGVFDLVGQECFTLEALPALTDATADPVQAVRIAATEALMVLAAKFSPDAASAIVAPHILRALDDETPEVRLAVLDSLAKVVNVLGGGSIESTLIPMLTQLAEDPVWRVRERVITQLPLLASSLVSYRERRSDRGTKRPGAGRLRSDTRASPSAKRETRSEALDQQLVLWLKRLRTICTRSRLVGFSPRRRFAPNPPPPHFQKDKILFEEKLLPLYVGYFQDQVHAVRMTATRCLEQLALNMGEEWIVQHVVPSLLELFSAVGSPYLQRITALVGLRALCVPGASATTGLALPIFLTACSDNVPNVRAVAATVLGIVGAAGLAKASSVDSALKPLLADQDSDVRYAAEIARDKLAVMA